MKVLFVFVSTIALAFGAELTTTTAAETTVKPVLEGPVSAPEQMTRDLPADVLRDFVGLCFASTLCRVFEVGQTWELTPFCGKAACILSPQGFLVERVQDCGILPKPNENCHIINEEAKNEPFPACCPKFQCEKGATIEYPTQEELQAALLAEQAGIQTNFPGTTTPETATQ